MNESVHQYRLGRVRRDVGGIESVGEAWGVGWGREREWFDARLVISAAQRDHALLVSLRCRWGQRADRSTDSIHHCQVGVVPEARGAERAGSM